MHYRWYSVAVVGLWLTTMGWLVVKKVVPAFRIGSPPSYDEIVKDQIKAAPVGWRMSGGTASGWALTDTKPQATQLNEIRGRVHFDMALKDLMPGLLQPIVRFLEKPPETLRIDARSVLTIDPLGRLVRFDSAVRLEPFNETIGLKGVVEEGRKLQLAVRIGNKPIQTPKEIQLPSDALLSDVLSPQMRLPGLRLNQTWTVPVYSPFMPDKPLEIIHATVERLEPYTWSGTTENVWYVVYRGDAGSAMGGEPPTRGEVWVRPDGVVLQQKVMLFDAPLLFVRMTDDEARKLVERAGPQWWSLGNDPQGRNYD
jgi:hypothetical protein